MKHYLALLKVPGVIRILASQLVARFPYGLLSIGFLVFAERTYHSYGIAGAVLGSMSLGNALAGALVARLIGRWGIRFVVMGSATLCSAAITAMALIPMSAVSMILLGFVAGCMYPPVGSATRTLFPRMVEENLIEPLYSLDATVQEFIWIIGPVLVTFVSIQVSATLGVLLSVFFFMVGCAWFVTSPVIADVQIPKSELRFGAVLRIPLVTLNTLINLLFIAGFAAAEAAIIAIFGDGNSQSGLVLGAWALGSLVGGLALGHIPVDRWGITWRMAITAGGTALALVSDDFWWLAATLFFAGVGVAPALAAFFSTTGNAVTFGQTPEAFGWLGTGQVIGAAAGSAVAGITIDHFGGHGALLVAVGFLVVGVGMAALSVPWMPRKLGLQPLA